MKKEKNTHSSVTCTSANKPVIRPRQDTSQFPSHVNRNHHIFIVTVIFEKSQCCLMRIECSFESFDGIIRGADRFGANLIGVIERIQAAACHRRAAWRWRCLKNGRRLKGSCPGEQRHTQKNEEEVEEEEARAAGRSRRRRGWPHSGDGLTAVAEQRLESSFWAARYQRRCLSDVCEIIVYCTQSLLKIIQIIYRVLHFRIHRYCIPKNIVLSTE